MSPSRILAALLALAVAATAVAFTLARQPEYRADVRVVAVERGALRAPIGPRYLREHLAAGRAELEVRLERGGVDARLLEGVRIERRPRPRGAVAISVAAATPARARRLLRQVVLQIDALSTRELTRLARRRLRAAEAQSAALLVGTPEQAAAQGRVRALRRYLERPRSRFGALAVRLQRPEGWADRLARAAPGPFPARPSPVWAGLAGAFVGASFAAAIALLRRRRWTA